MAQQTLFGETILKKKPEEKPDDEIEEDDEEEFNKTVEELKSDEEQFGKFEIDNIAKDEYGWEQLRGIEAKEVGLDYVDIQLMSRTDLGGTEHYVSTSTSSEHPLGMSGSCWGGGGVPFNPNKLDEIRGYFNMLMERKKEILKEVYRKFTKEETEITYSHHNVYSYFRLIPASNYFIIIGDRLLEMITKTGFDFDKWYDEYKSLPENEAMQEHWDNALEILNLYKKGDKICNRLSTMERVKKGEEKDSLTMFLTDEVIEEDMSRLPHSLKEIAIELKEREERNGCSSYSTPFWWELKHYGVEEENENKQKKKTGKKKN